MSHRFASCGTNVIVHPSVQIFNPEYIHIGSNVRIDCFCLLSASKEGIYIGDYVHIAAGCMLFGSGGKIHMDDFSGISSSVCIYTASDDYTGEYLTNPMVDEKYKKITKGDVILKKHVIVGSQSIIMPNVTMDVGAASGAMSFITKSVPEFTVVFGIPAKKIKDRRKDLIEKEAQFLESKIKP